MKFQTSQLQLQGAAHGQTQLVGKKFSPSIGSMRHFCRCETFASLNKWAHWHCVSFHVGWWFVDIWCLSTVDSGFRTLFAAISIKCSIYILGLLYFIILSILIYNIISIIFDYHVLSNSIYVYISSYLLWTSHPLDTQPGRPSWQGAVRWSSAGAALLGSLGDLSFVVSLYGKIYGNIWEHMGKYGKIWETMGKYGKIWETMGNYGKIWEFSGKIVIWSWGFSENLGFGIQYGSIKFFCHVMISIGKNHRIGFILWNKEPPSHTV